LVRDYLNRFAAGPRCLILDPFSGTGTTLVECKKLGIPSVGVEAHPMAHFAASVKTDWRADAEAMVAMAEKVAGRARKRLAKRGKRLSLPQEQAELLLANSISPLPLHKTLVLLEELGRDGPPHLRLALAKSLVTDVGNLHFGPEVGVGPAKEDAPVIESWLANVKAMAEDLRELKPRAEVPCVVFRADARQMTGVAPNSIHAVITSPPYPNEKDYTRTTRLESVLLGFISDKAELKLLKQDLLRSNTRNVYKGDDDDRWITAHPEIGLLASSIEARRIEMGKTSGFERLYARVTALYFGGMARHLAQLRPFLRPGARLAYVVGDQASFLRVMIRTGELLAGIAEKLGYRVEGIDLFRTRIATATREQLREEVVVMSWPAR
jgi:DNA methylase